MTIIEEIDSLTCTIGRNILSIREMGAKPVVENLRVIKVMGYGQGFLIEEKRRLEGIHEQLTDQLLTIRAHHDHQMMRMKQRITFLLNAIENEGFIPFIDEERALFIPAYASLPERLKRRTAVAEMLKKQLDDERRLKEETEADMEVSILNAKRHRA